VNAKRLGTLLVAALVVVSAGGCGRDNLTNLAEAPRDPLVFGDDFGNAVDYQAFSGSKVDAVQMDFAVAFNGPASLRITVPAPGDPSGSFAGGAFATFNRRDLSSYDALSFYAKASMNATFDIVGLANDNTGTSLYQSSREAIPLTTDWVRVIVPIPNPARLTDEGGLFFFAEGHENGLGYDIWVDEVEFVEYAGITNPRPFMDTRTQTVIVGGEIDVSGTGVIFDLGREDVTIDCFPACLDYDSSDEDVVSVSGGSVSAVGSGSATVTSRLGEAVGTGTLTLNVFGAPDGPADAPTVPADDVISLFSNVYDDVPVDTWHTPWSGSGEVADFQVEGDDVKLYTDLSYAGIEFVGPNIIDAATPGMTHLHMDLWAPSGGLFKVKLVDFGANAQYGGGDDSEYELFFNGGTVPPFFSGQWSYLDIPLTDFVGLTSTEHLAQMVISSSDVNTVIVDNVYFHR